MPMTELEWAKSFADKVKQLLKEWGMSQQELAKESGLSKSTISRCLSGKYIPEIRTVINIGYALGCNEEDLIDFYDTIY